MAVRSGEFDLIARYFAPIAARSPASLALRDDAAVFSPPQGHEIVVTTDALVGDVHFRSEDDPANIACKVLRVNLSDLAAMGATPSGVVLTTGFNRDISEDWIATFAKGFGEDCALYDVALLGGDTVATPGPSFFSLTAFGSVKSGQALRRDHASIGDLVAVTGTIGDAALGLAVLQDRLISDNATDRDHLTERYWLPRPRMATGQACAALGRQIAAMDISDGLLGDAHKIAVASGIGIEIDRAKVPLSDAAQNCVKNADSWWSTILDGGDDYELLICAPDDVIAELDDQVTIIGRVTDQAGKVFITGPDGKMVEAVSHSFDHFSER
ncbi:MAG: thiamine-phosphate kinase [Pseudomonadota bacterium]